MNPVFWMQQDSPGAMLALAVLNGGLRPGLISFIHNSFEGLSLASVLILMGLGLSIIFGLMRVINMAHGEFMMIGAFAAYTVSLIFERWMPRWTFNYYWFFAIPAAFFVSACIGWFCEFLIIRHLHGRELDSMLATWGISLALIQVVRLVFGDTTSIRLPSWFLGGWEVLPGLVLPTSRIFIILYTALCICITAFVIYRTRYGRLLRAASQNQETSELLGINVDRINRSAFAFGAGMAGLAGCAVILIDKLNPQMGQSYLVDSFLVVVGGGVGKIAGVAVTGVGLGFITKYLEPIFQAVYGKIVVLLLVVVLIRFRPSGLFAPKGRLSDD